MDRTRTVRAGFSTKRIAQPVDPLVVDRAHVESACGPGLVAETALEQVLRLQADAALLGRRDARGGATVCRAGASTHLDEHPLRAIHHDEIDLPERTGIVARQQAQAGALEMAHGAILGFVAALLGRRTTWPRRPVAHRGVPGGRPGAGTGTGTKPEAGGAGGAGTGTKPPLPVAGGVGARPGGVGGWAGTGTKPEEEGAGVGAKPEGAGIGAKPPGAGGAGVGAGTGTKPGDGGGAICPGDGAGVGA